MNHNEGGLGVELLVAIGLAASVLTVAIQMVFSLQEARVARELAARANEIMHIDAVTTSRFTGPLHLLSFAAVSEPPFTLLRSTTHIALCSGAVKHGAVWEGPRSYEVSMDSIITSLASVADSGQDCPVSGLSRPWNSPRIKSSFTTLSRIQYHGVDVINRGGKRIALVAASSTQVGDPDLFIFDVTDPGYIVLLSQLDTGEGIFALDAAGSHVYAAAKGASSQFHVIDISVPTSPLRVATRTLTGVSGSFPEGRSIFFFKDRVYIGTYETAGPEFHIFNVSNPVSPLFLGSKAVNYSIRQIVVREEVVGTGLGLIAYAASSGNAAEVEVLNVTNPSAITSAAVVDAPGVGSGTALVAAGSYLWLARQQVSGDPSFVGIGATLSSPLIAALYNPQLKSGTIINGLATSNGVLVATTTDTAAPLLVCAISSALLIEVCTPHKLFSSPGRIDVEDDLLFVPAGNTFLIIEATN